MTSEASFREAIACLRAFQIDLQRNTRPEYENTWAAKEQVFARYQPVFSLENIPTLTKDEFYSFLLYKNNRHWFGLQRQGPKMTVDMELLREALTILVDDARPMKERLETLITTSGSMVPGFGRATITAILLVKYPEEYGVWNATSEGGMREIGVWPEIERGSSFADRYLAMNAILNRLSHELELDLWDLDTIFWLLLDRGDGIGMEPPYGEDEEDLPQRFGLERYLQEFLRDNWSRIEFFHDWDIYEEDGDQVGYEYRTDIGRIDLLAKHRTEPNWLVIELKRDQSSDETVGQVLRYMGWVEEKLTLRDELVQGLIISRIADDRMKYALRNTRNVDQWFYEVDFHLKPSNQS